MITPATSNPCLTRNVFLPALLNPARTAIVCEAASVPSAADLRPAHNNNFFRLTTTDESIGRWAEAHNPFFAGPNADLLAMLPFAALVLFLYWVARERPRPTGQT